MLQIGQSEPYLLPRERRWPDEIGIEHRADSRGEGAVRFLDTKRRLCDKLADNQRKHADQAERDSVLPVSSCDLEWPLEPCPSTECNASRQKCHADHPND